MSTPPPPKTKQATPTSSSTPNGRVFTETDEIRLLKTYLKRSIKAARESSSPYKSTAAVDSSTFARINKVLGSRFTQAQVSDKLRRSRAKYHKLARSKSRIKTPHDEKFYRIAQQIWGKKPKPGVSNGDVQVEDPAIMSADGGERQFEAADDGNEPREESEAVDLEDYSALVSEFSRVLPHNSMWREGLKQLGNEKLKEMNERWLSIEIEEAKIAAKRGELVNDHTRLIMEVLGYGNNGNWWIDECIDG